MNYSKIEEKRSDIKKNCRDENENNRNGTVRVKEHQQLKTNKQTKKGKRRESNRNQYGVTCAKEKIRTEEKKKRKKKKVKVVSKAVDYYFL